MDEKKIIQSFEAALKAGMESRVIPDSAEVI